MDVRKFLLRIFLFDSFTEKELSLLEPSLSLKKVQKREQIFSEGMDASAFFIVVSGKVKIYKVSPVNIRTVSVLPLFGKVYFLLDLSQGHFSLLELS